MYTLGIDIGSTSSKAVVLEDGERIIARALYSLGTGTSGASRVIDDLFENAGLSWEDIAYCIATGYGRQRFEQADEEISELSCHALGMNYLIPGVRTIIDIGGQDVKVLSLNEQGTLEKFVMNEKCAAGTGRFLDVMAGVLETSTDELGILDAQSIEPVKISSTCTVFAESEVISHLAEGDSIPDIVAGIHNSCAQRTAGLARRLGVTEPVGMSGGVARNTGVVHAREREIGAPIAVPGDCQFAGAIGAALKACQKAKSNPC
ncbi:MAG: acyl-CoA dehydratase activase [Eggerthellaceae bacterium]